MKSYSLDLRERVVAGRRQGQSAEELAKRFGICKRSVERYWERQQQVGSVEAKQRGGYRRSRLVGHEETLRGWIQAQADLTLEQLQERLRVELGIELSVSALWYGLDRLGLSFKKNAARRRARAS
jgi:transposase